MGNVLFPTYNFHDLPVAVLSQGATEWISVSEPASWGDTGAVAGRSSTSTGAVNASTGAVVGRSSRREPYRQARLYVVVAAMAAMDFDAFRWYEAIPLPPIVHIDPEPFSTNIDLFVHSREEGARTVAFPLDRTSYIDARNLLSVHVCDGADVEPKHDGRHTNIQNLLRVNVNDALLAKVTEILANIFRVDSADSRGQPLDGWCIVLECDAGRHRSLGWALVVALLLQELRHKVHLWVGRPRHTHGSRLCSVRRCNRCCTPDPLPPWLTAAWANRIAELIVIAARGRGCGSRCEEFITFIDAEFDSTRP
jgi:hypothetical protein